jgi:hypothetical protein
LVLSVSRASGAAETLASSEIPAGYTWRKLPQHGVYIAPLPTEKNFILILKKCQCAIGCVVSFFAYTVARVKK